MNSFERYLLDLPQGNFQGRRRSLLNGLLLFLITVSITITLIPTAVAQFPSLPSSSSPQSSYQTPWWDPNKAQSCGRLWCSRVHLLGRLDRTFEIALETLPDQSPSQSALAVEERARQVQRIYGSIYDQVREAIRIKRSNSSDSKESRKSSVQPLDLLANDIDPQISWQDLIQEGFHLKIHPVTPKIEVGVKNNETVIFVVAQPHLGLSQQTIITVTNADRLRQGQPIPEIAQQWRKTIYDSFSEALWGYELDVHYPFFRWIVVLIIVGILLVPIIFLGIISHLLNMWHRRLRGQLRALRESLTIDAESLSLKQTDSNNPEPLSEAENINDNRGFSKLNIAQFLSLLKKVLTNPKKAIKRAKQTLENTAHNLSDNIPKLSLKRQSFIKQEQNIVQLLLKLIFWLQLFSVLLGMAFIVLIFPEIRPYAMFFFGQAFMLPLIWMLVTIGDQILDFLIDSYLGKWAQEAQLSNPTSNRYTLRVSTYSTALKGGTTFLSTLVGIILTIMVFGFDPTVLASVGGVAFVLAFLSRNLFEDILNGVLILWTDRYAIGDIIQVGNISGLVEDMNIYTTQVRGSEGRLVTIPNSKITIVENLTKDWSRVEFKIEIAYDADVRKALLMIRQVSEAMEQDPDWQDKILEPATILGVDAISHQGIMIQVWIKTQAMQQWAVGREFRLRIKESFEEAAIKLGVPQQAIWHQNSFPDLAANEQNHPKYVEVQKNWNLP